MKWKVKAATRAPAAVLVYGRYVSKVWFVSLSDYAPQPHDWLATARKDRAGNWMMVCRWRYYRDDKVFGSQDVKRLYVVRCKSESKAIAAGNDGARRVAQGRPIHEILLKTDDADEQIRLMDMQPWNHRVPPGEKSK